MSVRESLHDSWRILAQYLSGARADEEAIVPSGLPADLTALLDENVERLTEYQDETYAALYLDRVGRFIGRVDHDMLMEIARLLADRMAYEDLLWFAQLKFDEVKVSRANRERGKHLQQLYRFRVDELVSLLPEAVVDQVVPVLDRFRIARAPIPLRLGSLSWRSYVWLWLLAKLPRWRGLSLRYTKENAWCERWLHMIDRSLTRQPEAVREVIHSAALVRGHGQSYSLRLANWNRIIDGLAKPAFDRSLILSPLGEAIARAHATALKDPSGKTVAALIADIRATCAEQESPQPSLRGA